MRHTFNMKRFLTDQCIFFFGGLLVIVYLCFLLRRHPVFAVFSSLLFLVPMVYVCHWLIKLPLDKISGPRTVTAEFTGESAGHELQFFRNNICYEWSFKDENGQTLTLMIPEATTRSSFTPKPKLARKTRIEYYRLTKILVSWEIVE